MELVNIIGKMTLFIKASLQMVLDKVKDNGLVIKEISILDILVVIEKMAMENINGLMEIYIKVNFVKI